MKTRIKNEYGEAVWFKGFQIGDVRKVNKSGVENMTDLQGCGFALEGALIYVLVMKKFVHMVKEIGNVNIAIDNGTGLPDIFPKTAIDNASLLSGTDRVNIDGLDPVEYK